MAKANEPKKAGESTQGVEVIAKADVFYRAGRAWSNTPTVVPLSELTEEQLQELQDEPMLIVRTVEIKPEAKAEVSA